MGETVNTKNPEADEATLTQAQSAALPLLAAGAKKKDAATAVGVCPQTISAWMHEPHFSAVLQSERERLAGLAAEGLREATGVAVATVVALVESGSESIRLKAATYFLDRVVLLTAGDPAFAAPADRTDSRQVLAALGVNC
jgi:hypothetical protein